MVQTSRYQTRTLKTRKEVETLREFWSSLELSRDADFDFFLFIADLYPETLRPHVVVLYDGETPKALLAGRLDETKLPVRIGYIELPVPKMKIIQFVHGGWLGDITQETSKLLIGGVIEALSAGEADAAQLHCPDLTSPLVQWASRLPLLLCSDYLIQPQAHRVRELPDMAGTFLASLSQNERYQQRKRAKKFEEDFKETEVRAFIAPEDVGRLMSDAEAIAKTSYQRGLGTGFCQTPTIEARLAFEAARGWLRGYVLYCGNQPCAFWIGSLRNQVFLSDYLAFDPAYSQYGPGMYLIVKVMEELNRGGSGSDVLAKRVDFGIGDATYKERLSNSHWFELPVYIFAPGIKGLAVNGVRSAAGRFNRLAKRLMGATPLVGNLKRSWRKRMAGQG